MLYYSAFALAMLSTTIGGHLDKARRSERPANTKLLDLISGMAGGICFILFIYGFWISWYAPFVAVLAGMGLFAVHIPLFGRVDFVPGISILSGLVSVVMTCAVIF